jgi:hypothetical protein
MLQLFSEVFTWGGALSASILILLAASSNQVNRFIRQMSLRDIALA